MAALQIRRGPSTGTYSLTSGEPGYLTDKKQLQIGSDRIRSILSWVTTAVYKTDDIILIGNTLFRCTADHTAATEFATDRDTYWVQIGKEGSLIVADMDERDALAGTGFVGTITVSNGGITGVTITSGGTGYTDGSTTVRILTTSGLGGSLVATVNGSGVVTGFTPTAGTGYVAGEVVVVDDNVINPAIQNGVQCLVLSPQTGTHPDATVASGAALYIYTSVTNKWIKIAEYESLDLATASTGAKGLIQLATTQEVTTGTDTNKAVTPSTLKTELDKKASLNSPTFTGTVGGISASMVGLGSVTNESKATMFTNPTFTGKVTGAGLDAVDAVVDATIDPTSGETNGKMVALVGTPHANYDGAANGDVVKFVTSAWTVYRAAGSVLSIYNIADKLIYGYDVTNKWTTNTYSKTEVEGLDEWEISNGVIRPKDPTKDMRIGTSSDTYTCNEQSHFDSTGSVNITWFATGTGYWQNNLSYNAVSVGNITSSSCTAAGDILEGQTIANTYDGNTTTRVVANSGLNGSEWEYTFNTGRTFARFGILGYTELTYSLNQIKIEVYSNSQWTTVYPTTAVSLPHQQWTDFDLTPVSNATKLRLTIVDAGNGVVGRGGLYEVRFFTADRATTSNTVDANFTYTGTKNFAPATLKIYDATGAGEEITNNSAVIIDFSTNNGSTWYTDNGQPWYGLSPTVDDFQALSTSVLAGVGSNQLNIRLKPVGDQKISAVEISTPASEVLLSPAGEMSIVVNGTTTNILSNKISASIVTAANDFIVGTGNATIAKKTAAETKAILDATLVSQTKTDNYTLAEADSGIVTKIATDAKVFTLPSTAAGLTFVIMNSGADGNNNVRITPGTGDKIMGGTFTSADDKYIDNTKATSKTGDYVKLVGDGSLGWYIQEIKGIWTRES